jgi:hypothetical protein
VLTAKPGELQKGVPVLLVPVIANRYTGNSNHEWKWSNITWNFG